MHVLPLVSRLFVVGGLRYLILDLRQCNRNPINEQEPVQT